MRACFFLRFEDQKKVPSLSYCFASIFIGLRLSRPALKPASKLALRCFVLIFMVSRHWSSRLALRPAFNFVSSFKLCFCCNIHQLEASRLALTALHDNLQFIFLLRLNVCNDLAKAMKALDGKKASRLALRPSLCASCGLTF